VDFTKSSLYGTRRSCGNWRTASYRLETDGSLWESLKEKPSPASLLVAAFRNSKELSCPPRLGVTLVPKSKGSFASPRCVCTCGTAKTVCTAAEPGILLTHWGGPV
jgi:hypothetical protein